MKINTPIRTPSFTLLLIPLVVAITLISCGSVDSSWVVNDDQYDTSDSVYYVLDSKSPFGEAEKNEDPEHYQRICLLLQFDKQSTPDADGNFRFAAQPLEDASWRTCHLYSSTDNPDIDLSSIPPELAAELGIE
ncbi:MAG: hypothetical protein HQ477_01890 [Chloroflexi bacterium]|jgi:hypothetical protein|nr:hypothetical protein [Chloroflexota bacterium]